MNPLLDFSSLPRFNEVRPEHVTPAIEQLIAEGRACHRGAPATWDEFVAPLEDANERLGRAWGQVAHLHAVMDSPSCARPTTRTCPRSRVLDRARPERGAVREVQGAARARRVRALSAPARQAHRRERAARLPPRRRRAAAGEEAALRRDPGRARAALGAKFSENVLDATNAFSHRTSTTCALAGLPTTCCRRRAKPRRRPARRAGSSRCTHAVLPAGDAVRRGPRAARDAVPRLARRAPPSSASPRWDNTRSSPHPRAAPRTGEAARLRELRRGVARPRWPSRRRRCSRSCATSRAARKPFAERDSGRAARVRARRARPRRLQPGTSPTRPRS
jgi:hypothetical protein